MGFGASTRWDLVDLTVGSLRLRIRNPKSPIIPAKFYSVSTPLRASDAERRSSGKEISRWHAF